MELDRPEQKMTPQIALVTGGASGMGRICALRLANQGAKVAVVDMDPAGLESLQQESSNIFPYLCDVSDLAGVEGVLAEVRAQFGFIHRVVHCAAIMPTACLAEQETETIHRLMRINYGGTVNVTKSVLPAMFEKGAGELVVFGSTGGSVLVPECGAYCASKAAVNAYTEILIEENRGRGVHIMLVCPPLVDTPLLQQAVETSNPKSVRDSIEKKRFADPEFIVDEVEKGLKRKIEILLPGGEAKFVMAMRRYFPRLLWKIVHYFNRE
jgi:NAD(P)-dependent dehydrogenase (short-subunit alcohol dehydrogenase family)